MREQTSTISVIGLGKLGACFAAFYADHGFNIIGIDPDSAKVSAIIRGKAPVIEPELEDLVMKNKQRLNASNDSQQALLRSNISFIIVPTPSQNNGFFSVKYVIDAMQKLGTALKNKKDYHLFVLVSTVLPEDSREKIIPVLEKYSSKKCGKDFGYCYSPSLVALGNIIGNLRNPDLLFLGAYDQKSADTLQKIYMRVYNRADLIKKVTIESAEIAKIALNSYITMKITFANTLGHICHDIPHADIDQVTNAIGNDRRVGLHFLRSGLGYGGPCFPRDNFAFAAVTKKRSINSALALNTHKIALHTHKINESIPGRIAEIIDGIIKNKSSSLPRSLESTRKSYSDAIHLAPTTVGGRFRRGLDKSKTVGILSLTYKPNTPVLEESQAIKIALNLIAKKYSLAVYDQFGYDQARKILGSNIYYAKNAADLLKNSDAILIANPDPKFQILPEIAKKEKHSKIIIDPWRMFSQDHFQKNIEYYPLGRHRSGR